jgi:hypothetical protein
LRAEASPPTPDLEPFDRSTDTGLSGTIDGMKQRKAPRRPKRSDDAKLTLVPDLAKVRADLEEAEKAADTTLKAYGALLRRR